METTMHLQYYFGPGAASPIQLHFHWPRQLREYRPIAWQGWGRRGLRPRAPCACDKGPQSNERHTHTHTHTHTHAPTYDHPRVCVYLLCDIYIVYTYMTR